jgi:hypothetical protein
MRIIENTILWACNNRGNRGHTKDSLNKCGGPMQALRTACLSELALVHADNDQERLLGIYHFNPQEDHTGILCFFAEYSMEVLKMSTQNVLP